MQDSSAASYDVVRAWQMLPRGRWPNNSQGDRFHETAQFSFPGLSGKMLEFRKPNMIRILWKRWSSSCSSSGNGVRTPRGRLLRRLHFRSKKAYRPTPAAAMSIQVPMFL
jgi:hypothetical protein